MIDWEWGIEGMCFFWNVVLASYIFVQDANPRPSWDQEDV